MTIAEIILLGPGEGNTGSVLGDQYTFKGDQPPDLQKLIAIADRFGVKIVGP